MTAVLAVGMMSALVSAFFTIRIGNGGALPLILINSNNNDWSEDVDEDMVVVKEELVW